MADVVGLSEEVFEMLFNSMDNAGEESVKRDARLIAAEIIEQGGMPQALAEDHDADDEQELDDAITKIEALVLKWQAMTFPSESSPEHRVGWDLS